MRIWFSRTITLPFHVKFEFRFSDEIWRQMMLLARFCFFSSNCNGMFFWIGSTFPIRIIIWNSTTYLYNDRLSFWRHLFYRMQISAKFTFLIDLFQHFQVERISVICICHCNFVIFISWTWIIIWIESTRNVLDFPKICVFIHR